MACKIMLTAAGLLITLSIDPTESCKYCSTSSKPSLRVIVYN